MAKSKSKKLTRAELERVVADVKARLDAHEKERARPVKSLARETAGLAAETLDLYGNDPFGVRKAAPLTQKQLERDLKRLPPKQLQRLGRAVQKVLAASA